MDVSVILILEQPEQTTGSGCCGKLGGDAQELCGVTSFSEVKATRERFGVLHRTIREFFPAERVSVTTVDPRNQLYLLPKLWYDVCRFRPGWKTGLRTAFECFSLPAVLVNGRVISDPSRLISPDELCHAITQYLAEPDSLEESNSRSSPPFDRPLK